MNKFKLPFLVFTILAFGLVFSGCVKKVEEAKNVNINTNINEEFQVEDVKNDDQAAEEIDTSGWKTYRNEEYGFEFKYPEEWEIKILNREGSDTEGFFVLNGESRLGVLPRGEFDYGLPFDDPIISEFIIDGRKSILKKWNLAGGGTLLLYQIVEEIPGWINCSKSLKNCNRIELLAKNSNDLEVLQNIIMKIIFN